MKIDLEKFICSLLEEYNFYPEPSEEFKSLINALKQQGLSYKNGKIVEIEPKQEWSEEDKEYINDLIGVFDGQQYQAHSDEEIVKWLKSIRLPYNKEWDESDEEMLRSIIATCELAEQEHDSSPAKHLLEMQLNWLKSLKEKCTWKPSDEQMIALQEAINIVGILTLIGSKINSLYQDLKKLKG